MWQCCWLPAELSVRQGRCSAELNAGVPCAVDLPGSGIAWLAKQICEWAVAIGRGVPLCRLVRCRPRDCWVAPFCVASYASVCCRVWSTVAGVDSTGAGEERPHGRPQSSRRWGTVCEALQERLVFRLANVGALPCGEGAERRGGACGARAPSASGSYLVDPASSHMLVSKTKPCMSKYKCFYTVKLRMAH